VARAAISAIVLRVKVVSSAHRARHVTLNRFEGENTNG
jgi:hypothetical protein